MGATNLNLVEHIPDDSWVRSWHSAWPLVESADSFIIFAGYAILGAFLGRSCWIDHDQRKLWPMLNTLLIGPSGCGKTTALELGIRNLLEHCPPDMRPAVIEGGGTPEKLHEDFSVRPHAIMYAEELAAFFNKQDYNQALIPYVTELLNYKPFVERRTKGGGIRVAQQPSVVVLGASTKEWLQKQMPDAALAGGFLARFLIVVEEHKRQRVALPGQLLTKRARLDLEHLRHQTTQQFIGIVQAAQGPIKFYDMEASDEYVYWYNTYQPAGGHLAPFAARAGEFVQRLAMLTAISRNQDYITADDVKAGIALYDYATRRLATVVVSYSREGELLAKVLEVVGTGVMDAVSMRRAMRHQASARDVDRLVESLISSGELHKTEEGLYRRVQFAR